MLVYNIHKPVPEIGRLCQPINQCQKVVPVFWYRFPAPENRPVCQSLTGEGFWAIRAQLFSYSFIFSTEKEFSSFT